MDSWKSLSIRSLYHEAPLMIDLTPSSCCFTNAIDNKYLITILNQEPREGNRRSFQDKLAMIEVAIRTQSRISSWVFVTKEFVILYWRSLAILHRVVASITDAFGLHNLLYPFGDHFFGAVCLLLPFQKKKKGEREREREQYRKTILQETKKRNKKKP